MPAWFVPVNKESLQDASLRFKNGEKKVAFVTDANINAEEVRKNVKRIYFKNSGINYVILVADFIDISTKKPIEFKGDKWTGKYYYRFSNLKELTPPISVDSLVHYDSKENLRNDSPCPYIIEDPFVK